MSDESAATQLGADSAASPLRVARQIGADVLAPRAREVDRDAQFPVDGIEALRRAGLLAAAVPQDLGGFGSSPTELVAIGAELARHCASTAMVWSMHQIQVGCIVHHGSEDEFFRAYATGLVETAPLLASATSEVGVGGDIRTSIAAVERHDGAARIEKQAPTVSYGEAADGYLITARRAADAPSGDQVLVLARREQVTLEPTSTWDTLGMRGTCSPGFRLAASVPPEQIMSAPFGEVASRTMVPLSHLLWSGVWVGIAADAVSRARRFLRKKARADSGPGAAGAHLAEAARQLQLAKASVERCGGSYEQVLAARSVEDGFTASFAVELNNLKLSTSTLAVGAIESALAVCGMAGYSEASPYGVARHLRDAFSARLMVSNDRLVNANGQLLLAASEDVEG